MKSCPWQPSVVISGTAPGADRFGEKWAAQHHVSVERFPAAWDLFGKAAGSLRNAQMAEAAEALVAVWDGESAGTRDMIAKAKAAGLKVHVHMMSKAEPVYQPGTRPVVVFDIEIYPDYFMVGFKTVEGRKLRQFEMFEGHPLDTDTILQICQSFTVVGFNNIDFDSPVMLYVIRLVRLGHSIADAIARGKALADRIINGRLRS